MAKDKTTSSKVVTNLLITVIVMTVLISLLMFLGLTYVVTIITIAVMPSIVANVVEKRKRRYASKTVTAFNLAGVIPHIISLARAGDPNMTAKGMMTDPYIWLIIYGLAGFGWIMVQVIPQITFLFLLIKAEMTIKQLKHLQEDLVKEWGEQVKGG